MTAEPAAAPGREPEVCVFANARLVLPDETVAGSLVVEDGVIIDIAPGHRVTRGAVDCEGDLLAPALVELHTDNLERHLQPRPGVKWPLRPAIVAHDAELASVGIGTVFDALRVGSIPAEDGSDGTPSRPGGPGRAEYERYARPLATEILALRADGALRIGHMLHLRAEICSETLLDELAEFGPEDRVRLLSMMDHTPGHRQYRKPEKLRDYLRGRYGMDEAAVDAHFRRLSDLRDRFGARHEEAIVAHARRLGATLASHDDTTEAQVEDSAAKGAAIAEFPTTVEAARACRARGVAVMMGAPNLLRGGSHSGNVRAEELADAGLLDILSSDYAPASLLAGAVRLGEAIGDLAAGFATVTAAPARLTGLSDRGRLEPGLRADLVRIRLDGVTSRITGHWHQGRRVA